MTTCIPRLAKGRPEFLLYPGNGHISILIIGGSGVVIIGVGHVVGAVGVSIAVNVLMHLTEHRVPGTNLQLVPGLSQHFIPRPHSLFISLGHISSGVGLHMHLKEH